MTETEYDENPRQAYIDGLNVGSDQGEQQRHELEVEVAELRKALLNAIEVFDPLEETAWAKEYASLAQHPAEEEQPIVEGANV